MTTLIKNLSELTDDVSTQDRAQKYGLTIQNVSWEDIARLSDKPNTSNMALRVKNYNMPIIRISDNYEDKTCEIPIENFSVIIGNETKNVHLRKIKFKDFLVNIQEYTQNNYVRRMFTKRDTTILTSVQTCILPASIEFNVQINKYRDAIEPKVLVIVASNNGTSCQILTEPHQKLYFNEAGMATNFISRSLNLRAENPWIDQRNVMLIFQIPIRELQMIHACSIGSNNNNNNNNRNDRVKDTDISQENTNIFKGIGKYKIIRDDKYPIRCTVQFYKVTNTSYIPESEFSRISDQMNAVYKNHDIYGSVINQNKKDNDRKRKAEEELPQREIKKIRIITKKL